MFLLLAYVSLALCVSFVCSILESVLLSVTPSHVSLLEQEGHPAAGRLRELKDDIDRPLAAILSLNTIANTLGATGAGAQAARLFGSAWLGVFSAVFTLLVLTGSEIIPKTLGAVHWKRLAPLLVRVLPAIILLMLPLVKMARWLTRLLTPRETEPAVSRAEIAAIAEEGAREGVVERRESRVLQNLLRLAMLQVHDVMTPAECVVGLPEEMEVGEALERVEECRFSRVPLLGGSAGSRHYTGYVLKDEILEQAARDNHRAELRTLAREILVVPASMPVPDVFEKMVERREHIAVAAGARDELVGLLTMEDVIETLLGMEILDEADEEVVRERARAGWRQRARRHGLVREPAEREAVSGMTGGEPPVRG